MNRRQFLAISASSLAATPPEEGFTPLFDGKSLNGWVVRDGPASGFAVENGEIAAKPEAEYPAWLSTTKQYENFELRLEFFTKGWTDGGVYLHAPEHGRPTYCGIKINIFHQVDKTPMSNSMGSVFPLIAPKLVNVKPGWNDLRIRVDWPRLQVWSNQEQVQDVDCQAHPDLRWRLRRGYIGLVTLSYPHRFRHIRLKELPSKDAWETLYETPADFSKWVISDSNPRNPVKFEPLGEALRGDGLGNLATKEKYRDFALQMYVRHARHHNGGVLFRRKGASPASDHYEIQLHDVEDAHYPTGSLYHFKRSIYPRIEAETWWLFQMWVKDNWCLVRINGENVLEYDRLENLTPGPIELQAHQAGRWTEYKHICVQRL
jgi:hypothetical protein